MCRTANLLLSVLVLLLGACAPAPAISLPVGTDTPAPTATFTQTPSVTPVPATPTLQAETAFMKGITLNYSGNGPKLGDPDSLLVIDQVILPAGANYVALVPSCWSKTMKDTTINCDWQPMPGVLSPVPDEELVGAIRQLHSRGLRVALKPNALIESVHATGTEKKDRHFSEAEWKAWFESYTAFITHYAALAEENDVDLFVVGTEQEDNTQEEQGWREVIAAVRQVYHGPITYAPNSWGFEASHIKFWDALDYIATNAYGFGFVANKDASIEDMLRSSQPYLQRMQELSQEYGKPVIITEAGARALDGWNTGEIQDLDPISSYDAQEQADVYAAFFEAIQDKPWIQGIFIWDIDTMPLQGGPYDTGYTFVGKPAEAVLRRYFGGALLTVPVPLTGFEEDSANSVVLYDDQVNPNWSTWAEPGASVVPNYMAMTSHAGSHSIMVPISKYQGLDLDTGPTGFDSSRFKWIDFYLMVGEHTPDSLLVRFGYWSPAEMYFSRMVRVDPAYLEGGAYQPGTWQYVRIPLLDMGITDQVFNEFFILACPWPCKSDPRADDIYVDDIRLVAGKPVQGDGTATPSP